jgi:hypothetical protein
VGAYGTQYTTRHAGSTRIAGKREATRESSTQKKTPTGTGWGSAHTCCRPFPSQGRLSARQGRSPGSRHPPTLCTFPRTRPLSGLCRFRSAHSCGAAMDFHHLPWSQSPTMTDPTSDICNSLRELRQPTQRCQGHFCSALGCRVSPSQRCAWTSLPLHPTSVRTPEFFDHTR